MEISISAEQVGMIFGFPITNAFFVAVLVAGCLAICAFLLGHRLQKVPGRFQGLVEVVAEWLLGLLEEVLGDRTAARRFFPLIATIFCFVLLVNWVGLLPGVGAIGIVHHGHDGHETIVPFLRSTSADLNFTLALSLIVMFTIQFVGLTTIGLAHYGKKFLVSPLQKPYGIGTLVGLLEAISEVGKIISFTFRLFGNVFAGEVLLTVMFHLAPYVVPLPFLIMEVFVGVIQAAVFALLTIVFLKMSMTPPAH